MTRSQSEMDDLKNLQREAAELREKRKRTRSSSKPGKDETPDPEAEADESDPADEGQLSEQDTETAGLAVHLDSVIHELETLARKHPSLALVSAFTAGFFAGKLFTRR